MEYEIHKIIENGVTIYPATTSSAVIHPQVEKPLTQLINTYNMTALFPGEVENDEWSLQSSITYLDQRLASNCKVPGTRIMFLQNDQIKEYEYYTDTYTFSNPLGWKETGLNMTIVNEIEEAVFPVTPNFSIVPDIIEAEQETSITMIWSTYRRGTNVTANSINKINNEIVSGSSTSTELTLEGHSNRIFSFSTTYQGITRSVNAVVRGVYKTFYGAVDEGWIPTTENLKTSLSLSGVVGSKKMDWTGINLTNKCTAYAYDAVYGELVSITDANGFEYIDSYNKYTVEDENEISYYVYVLKNPTTISGFKQSFS